VAADNGEMKRCHLRRVTKSGVDVDTDRQQEENRLQVALLDCNVQEVAPFHVKLGNTQSTEAAKVIHLSQTSKTFLGDHLQFYKKFSALSVNISVGVMQNFR